MPFWHRILGNSDCPHDNSSDMSCNHQICPKHVSWDTLGWYWKWGSLTVTFKVILAILTQNSKKFGLSMQQLVMDIELKPRNLYKICILRFSQLVLKMGVIDLDLQGYLTIMAQKKRHSTYLEYTDLGRLIVTCRLCVIYMREDYDSNVLSLHSLYRLHGPWYPKKAVKLNHSFTHFLLRYIFAKFWDLPVPSSSVACFTKEVNPRLAKRPLVFNGRLAYRRLTSLVKEATGG